MAVVAPFAEESTASVRAADDRSEVLYEPDPLPWTRYPGDHRGVGRSSRDAEADRRCQRLPGRAEVLFGIPDDSSAARTAVVRSHPSSGWGKGTAGTGEQVKAAGLSAKELERAAGMCPSAVHVAPSAGICPPGPHTHDRTDLR